MYGQTGCGKTFSMMGTDYTLEINNKKDEFSFKTPGKLNKSLSSKFNMITSQKKNDVKIFN